MKAKTYFLFLFLSLVLASLPSILAVSLDSSTILQSNESNITLTFSIPIETDLILIDNSSIYLENITCNNTNQFILNQTFNTPNSTIDSLAYCPYNALQSSDTKIICGNFFNGVQNLSASFIVFISLAGLVVIISIIGVIIFLIVNNGELNFNMPDMDGGMGFFAKFLLGLGGVMLVIFAVVIMVAMGVC
jgi:hypothetical protein